MDKMLEMALNMPEMLLGAYGLGLNGAFKKGQKIKNIVISGMGGSAIAGDIVAALFWDKVCLPIFVERGYHLPAFVDASSLVFILSYSGETEETLSIFKEARACRAKIVCVTSGGQVKNIAKKQKLPYFLVPAGLQPRAALAYLLVPILKVFSDLGLYPSLKKDLDEALNILAAQKNENTAGQLAKTICRKTPVILASNGLTKAVAIRLKAQFSENSKITSMFSVFPELCHNEIVSLAALERSQHNFCLLMLRDPGEPKRLNKRIEITKSLIGSQVGGIHEIWAKGESRLAKILSLTFFADLLSVYLALELGQDPSQIEVITRLKKELAR
ncbi:MAG: bifunctional phosphoglucose/phosphomannose isomerase [bacterium]